MGAIVLPGVYCTRQHHTVSICEMTRISHNSATYTVLNNAVSVTYTAVNYFVFTNTDSIMYSCHLLCLKKEVVYWIHVDISSSWCPSQEACPLPVTRDKQVETTSIHDTDATPLLHYVSRETNLMETTVKQAFTPYFYSKARHLWQIELLLCKPRVAATLSWHYQKHENRLHWTGVQL